MQDYDDEPVQRPKWLAWVIIIGMILVVLGLLNLGVRLYIGTPSDQATAAKTEAVAQQRPDHRLAIASVGLARVVTV